MDALDITVTDMDIPDIDSLNDAQCRRVYFENKYPEFLDYLCTRYPGLLLKEQLYLYSHGLDEAPRCPECGKPLKIYSFRRGYTEFCSQKCLNKSDMVKERRRQSMIERTGYDNPMHNPDSVEKLRKTMQEKYGVDNPFQSEEVKEKIRRTMNEKYGVDYPMQSEDILRRSSDEIRRKYGVSWNCMREEAGRLTDDSGPNRDFERRLIAAGIQYSREFSLENYRYDFKVGETLIEIDPTATHNSTMGIRHKEPLDPLYHQQKSQCAARNGYHCIHLWDWDDPDKIVDLLAYKRVVYARACKVREVCERDSNLFLKVNHLQGMCKGSTVRIGLYEGDTLVLLMTFGKPRYNKRYQWELLRMCSMRGVVVVGGAERLFKHFVDTCNPDSIISYCDLSKFSGDVYVRLGFVREGDPSPSGHWYSERTKKHITDNLLRARGFDQLFHTSYGKGTSNEELMVYEGFVEVFDCGQCAFTRKFH